MAKLALIYGMRLLPADEIETVGEAEIKLKNGKTAHVTMHLIDGGEKRKSARNWSNRWTRSSSSTRRSSIPWPRQRVTPPVRAGIPRSVVAQIV